MGLLQRGHCGAEFFLGSDREQCFPHAAGRASLGSPNLRGRDEGDAFVDSHLPQLSTIEIYDSVGGDVRSRVRPAGYSGISFTNDVHEGLAVTTDPIRWQRGRDGSPVLAGPHIVGVSYSAFTDEAHLMLMIVTIEVVGEVNGQPQYDAAAEPSESPSPAESPAPAEPSTEAPADADDEESTGVKVALGVVGVGLLAAGGAGVWFAVRGRRSAG